MPPLNEQELEAAIARLEAQRAILGDSTVELAVAGLRQQLADLRQTSSAPPPAPMEGERKLVTVMFADLSGFTALAERSDPEQLRSLMNACFEQLVPCIEKYEGTVDKFLGDAIVALFGAPLAHENDPERALRAALEMQEALVAFNERHQTTLGLHFGINTGLVVAGGLGSSGHQEYSVTGDAANVASRLEDASERGEILVGPETYRLAAPLFEFEPVPPIAMKGKTEPVHPYRLLALKAAPGPLRGIEGLRSPLVGRDTELQQLQEALRRLQVGQGSRLGIIAEAGQGKSRLVAEARQAVEEGVTWVEGRALSYTQGMSYWLARDLLLGLLSVSAEAPSSEVEQALLGSVEGLFPDQAVEVYPYLARLLELPLQGAMQDRVQYLTPEGLQQRILRAVADYVQARAQERSLALIAEDLHWADPSSLQLLEALLPLPDQVPLLLLFVLRPEEGRSLAFHQQAAATFGAGYAIIELAPLSRQDSTRLLDNLLAIENLPARTRRLILDKAEGNAFFLEEVLRSLIDAGLVALRGDQVVATHAIEELHVPDTLQGVIMARIDRLPPEDKQTLQTASVVGRVFQKRVLGYLLETQSEAERLEPSLAELRRRELIRLRASISGLSAELPLDHEYIFKHVLTQEVTYNSLLIVRRKALHKVTGEAIEALFAGHLDDLSATLGYHFERAEAHDKAARYLSRAADRARGIFANAEAIGLYRAALAQVMELSRSSEQPDAWAPMATQLNESLGNVLALTGGHEEARAAFERALAHVPAPDRIAQSRLHRRIGDTWMPEQQYEAAMQSYETAGAALGSAPSEADPQWWREWADLQMDFISVYYRLVQRRSAAESVQRMTELLEKTRPVIEQYGTPYQRGQFFLRVGLFNNQRDRWLVSDETIAQARAGVAAVGEHDNLGDLAYVRAGLGMSLLFRGELDEAEEHLDAALEIAERIGDVGTQTIGLTYRTIVARRRGRVEETRQYIARTIAAATAAQRPLYVGTARANQAWVAWKEGDLAAVRPHALAAREAWRHGYMFHWLGLWPLIAVALAEGEVAEAVEYARGLLSPEQAALPAPMTEAVEAALQTWDEGKCEAARSCFQRAVELAQELAYL